MEEKKNNTSSKDKDNAKQDESKREKGITYFRCSIHQVSYPKGGSCPECDKGKISR